jgi:hypothetical protein
MTRLDVIRMIGDMLTEIDVKVGSLMPGDPNIVQLQDLRRLLDSRQLMLARQAFDDNTPRFQAAAERLRAVNREVRAQLDELDAVVAVIGNVTRFLDEVTSFMTSMRAFT